MKNESKRKVLSSSTSLLVVLALILSAIFSVNVFADDGVEIINGGFENGLNNFQTTEKLNYEIVTDKELVYEGNKSVKLGAKTSSWNNAFLYQSVDVEKDSYYEWHLWFKSDSQSNKPCVGVRTADGTYLLPSTLSSNGGYVDSARAKFTEKRVANNSENWNQGLTTATWKEYVITFYNAEEDTVLLTLDMFYENRSGYTDSWSIVKTEAPVVGAIINGTFENGTKGFVNDKLSEFEIVEDPDQEGNHLLKVTGNATRGMGILYQKVAVQKNTEYSWTFRFKQSVNVRGDYTVPVVQTSLWGSIPYKVKTKNAVSDKWGIKSMRAWSELQFIFDSGENEEIILGFNVWADQVTVLTDDWVLEEYNSNTLVNGGFEDEVKEFSKDETLTLTADTENYFKGKNALKVTGNGLLKRDVTVNKYYDIIWSFYLKSSEAGKQVKAAVVSEKSGKIMPATVSVTGDGSASPDKVSGGENNTSNFFTLTAAKTYTKYAITFNPLEETQFKLLVDFPGDCEIFMDEWYLGGELSVATESIYNPGFEDGDFDTYSTDPYVTASIVTDNVHSGKYAVSIQKDQTVGSGYFYQAVNVKEYSDYLWTFWAKFDDMATPVGAEPRMCGGGTLLSHFDGDTDTVIEPSFAWHRIRYADNEWHKYSVVVSTGSNNKIELAFLAYAASAKVTLDDWTFEYLEPSSDSDTIIDVGFESEKMGAHEYSKQAWVVSDEEAHSGTHSIKFNGGGMIKGSDLLYRDKNGVVCDNTWLKKDTKYRFSFWYKCVGKVDLASLHFNIYSPNMDYLGNNYYGASDESWNYFEYVLDTAEAEFFRFQIASSLLGFSSFSIYVDDIKLEKISVGITDEFDEADKLDSASDKNIIKNGNIESSSVDSKWDSLEGTNVVLEEETTNKVIEIGGDKTKIIKKIDVEPFKEYVFSVNYRYKKNNGSVGGKLGLLCNDEGSTEENPITKTFSRVSDSVSITTSTKLITNKNAWDSWSNFSYKFTAPSDGVVYLTLEKTSANGLIQIDDIYLECLTPKCAPVKDMKQVKTEKESKKSIWDADFDFDFDWNSEEDFEFEEEPEIEDKGEELTEKKSNKKKMLQVKRRKLIKKGNPGIPDWIIIVGVSAIVIIAGGVTALIIFKKRKKKQLK